MQKRLGIFLSLLIVLMLIAVALLEPATKHTTTSMTADKSLTLNMIPEDIRMVKISNAKEPLLVAELLENEWRSTQLSSTTYPLEQKALVSLIRAIYSAKVVELKSDNPEDHYRLGLRSIDQSESSAVEVEFVDAKNQSVAVIIGNRATSQRGQYIRLGNQSQMVLVDQLFRLPSNQYDWLQDEIFPFSSTDIQFIDVIVDDQPTRLENSNIAEAEAFTPWTLSELGTTPRELRYPSIVADYVNDLLTVSYSQIQTRNAVQWNELDNSVTLLIEMRDGSVQKVEFAKNDDQHLMRIEATNQYQWLNDWIYTVPSYEVQRLTKSREDFFVQIP